MAFWFLAPVALLVGKKIYDAVTDDDISSSYDSTSTSSTITSAKTKRTKTRKKAIQHLLNTHRQGISGKLSKCMPKDGLVKVCLDEESHKLDFKPLNKKIKNLEMAKLILAGSHHAKSRKINTHNIDLHEPNEIVKKVLKNALNDYGELSAIDPYNDYIESDDPFLKALKKIKTKNIK